MVGRGTVRSCPHAPHGCAEQASETAVGAATPGVEGLLQRRVQRVDTGRPAVDRRQDLDVIDPDPEVSGRALRDGTHHPRDDGTTVRLLRDEHVAVDAPELPGVAREDRASERHDA